MTSKSMQKHNSSFKNPSNGSLSSDMLMEQPHRVCKKQCYSPKLQLTSLHLILQPLTLVKKKKLPLFNLSENLT